MAALEGFELSIATDDVVVAEGMLNGVAVAGVTLDVSVLALGDGENLVAIDDDGATIVGIAAATGLAADQVQLGSFTEDTGAATAVTMSGRGGSIAPSADE
jgi:hypothetical protein